MLIKIFSIIYLSFLSILHADGNFLIKQYGAKEGLSHSIVTSVLQDKKGYLWVGTYSGLNRFDGHEFRTYRIKENLIYDAVRALAEDNEGNLWIGTEQGLSRYSDEKFENFTEKDGLVNDSIRSLSIDRKGSLVIGTVEGVSIYKDKKFINFSKKDKLSSDFITTTFVDAKNTIWVGTNKGIFLIKNYKLKPFDELKEIIEDAEIISIEQDEDDSILISGKGIGIYRVRNDSHEQISHYGGIKFGKPGENDWIINRNNKGELNFVSNKKGIFLKDKEDYHKLEPDIEINSVISSLNDREGNTWFTTFGFGLFKVYPEKAKRITHKEGLKDTNIRYIFKDSRDRIWYGNQSYITLFEKGKYKFFQKANKTLVNKVRFITEGSDGVVWFGTGEGLMKYEKKKLVLDPITEKFSKKSVYAVAVFKEKLLIAIESGDLYEYDPDTKDFVQLDFKDKSIGIIWYMKTDKQGKNVIIQGPNGILKYNPDKPEPFEKFVVKIKHQDKLEEPRRVEKLLYFSDDEYILATDDKILIKNKNNEETLELSDYIPSSQIVSLHLDSSNALWAGTSRGVLRYEGKDRVRVFDRDDGLAGDNCMFHSIMEYKKQIYIGSSEGVSLFDNNNSVLNTTIPRPAISRLLINNTPVHVQDSIELNYFENDLQIYYSSLSLVRSDRLRYKFTLNGYDKKDANPITSRNFTIYNNLSPGTYTFSVDGTNNDGLWSEKPAKISFTIKPAFWQTNWFSALLLVAFLFLLYIIYRLRVRQIQLRNQQLEVMVQERTRELFTEKEKSETLLLNILPNEIAQELKNNNVTEPRQYQSVSVIFTDFVGFTGISEKMTPSELVKELNQYFMIFDSVLDRYNIEKLKTIGDGYMAAGGIPTPNNTHPIDSVLALLEIQRLIVDKNKRMANDLNRWAIRIGIHTGPLVAGVIGKKKFIYDVWGDTVNIASRLESSGAPNKINISADMHERVKDFFICEPRGMVNAKGKGSMEMFFVNSILPELSVDGQGVEPNDEFYRLYEKVKREV